MTVFAICGDRSCGWAGVALRVERMPVPRLEDCPACGMELSSARYESDLIESMRQHVSRYLLIPVDAANSLNDRAFRFQLRVRHGPQHSRQETAIGFDVDTVGLFSDDNATMLAQLLEHHAEHALHELRQSTRSLRPDRWGGWR